MYNDDAWATIKVLLATFGSVGALIAFFAVPKHESMKIESVKWDWSVQTVKYIAKGKELDSRKKGFEYRHREDAEEGMDFAKERILPKDAYDVKVTIKSETKKKKIGEDADGNPTYSYYDSYYLYFTYMVNTWDSFNTIHATGIGTDCHEPDRPYPNYTDIKDPKVGDVGCMPGHQERYTVTGSYKKGSKSFDISRADWETIHDKNATEIWFNRKRFHSDIYDVRFESEE